MRRLECFAPKLLIVIMIVLLGGGLLFPLPRADAQETPAAATGDETLVEPLREVLIQAVLEELPETPAFIRLVRVTLASGARVPMHVHPGPEFGRVESGTLTVRVDGEAVIAPASTGETPEPPRVAPVGEEFSLGPGNQIVYPADVPFTLSNQGEVSVSFLAILIVPGGSQRPPTSEWVGGTPAADELQGVTSEILGDALAPGWPEGDKAIVLDRLVLAPGETIPRRAGPVMIAVELGQFGFSLVEGQFQVSRGRSGPQPDATPGASYTLSPGDAAFFPGGINDVPRGDREGVLSVLRLSVLGVGEPNGSPTADDAAAADAPAAAETPAASAGGLGTGATVAVNSSGVRLRSGPSTDSDVVADLQEGRALIITGERVEGDGIGWYPVEATDDATVVGFIAEEFITAAA